MEAADAFVFTGRTAAALAVCFVASMISNSVGIGGSQIYVPMATVLLDWDFTSATALSLSIVAISSLGAVAQALLVHNPLHPGTTLADLQAALLLAPPLLCGVTVGVLANRTLPDWLLVFLFVPFLLLICYRTTLTGLRLWRKETAVQQQMLACTPIELEPSSGDLETAGQGGTASDAKPADGQRSTCTSTAGSGASPLACASPGGMCSFRAMIERQACATEPGEPQPGAEQPPHAAAQLRHRHSGRGRQFLQGTSRALRHTLQLVATGQCEEAHLDVDETVCLALRGSSADWQLRASSMILRTPPQASARVQQLQRFSTAPPVRSSSWGRPLRGPAPAARPDAQQDERSVDEQSSLGGSTAGAHRPSAEAQQQPRCRFPKLRWRTLAALAAVYAAYLGLVLGGNAAGACSVAWYVLVPLQFFGFLVLSALLVWRANRAHDSGSSDDARGRPAAKAAAASPGPPQHLGSSGLALGRFSLGVLAGIVAVTIVGGAVAALFGSGGGIVIVPLLLQLGVAMQPAASTSSILVFIGASAGALTQLVLGNLNVAYAGVFGGTALAASLLGTYLSRTLVRRLGRPSILVYMFVALLMAAVAVTIAFPVRQAIQELADGTATGARSVCSH